MEAAATAGKLGEEGEHDEKEREVGLSLLWLWA